MSRIRNFKRPSESRVIKTEVVFPNDTNPMNILQGGRLVQWMDIAAAVCAQLHTGRVCVTVSMDQVNFRNSAHVGDIVKIEAKITRAFNSSMEIFVEAFAGNTRRPGNLLINEAFFTFVALDEHAKPVPVPQVKAVTAEEKKLFAGALARRNMRRKD